MSAQTDWLEFEFQWTVGDFRALRKLLSDVGRTSFVYFVTVLTRLVSIGLMSVVIFVAIPGVGFMTFTVLLMAFSLSLLVAGALSIMTYHMLERLRATDARRVGWQHVRLDRRGIYWTDDVSQTYLSWLGVQEIQSKDGSIWIKSGAASGYYLPARLFTAEHPVEECLEVIARFRAESTPPDHLRSGEEESDELVVRH